MKKRYVNGILFTIPDYIKSVNLYRIPMNGKIESKWEIEGSIKPLLKQKYRIIYDTDKHLINFIYREGVLTRDLVDNAFFTVVDKNKELTFQGKINPSETVIINGLEYIKTENEDFNSFCIFLVHEDYDKGITDCKELIHKNILYYSLVDSIYKKWVKEDYINYINNSGYLYVTENHNTTDNFKIVNVYNAIFDNSIQEYNDISISGLVPEFYVNDASVSADFIRQIRKIYPEIQFYTREEDKDQTKYNEWINYKIKPSDIKSSNIFTSHVWVDPVWGRHWQTTLNIEFEYTSNDLPTLLARRDLYRVGSFLNEHDKYQYLIEDENGNKFNTQYVIFWDRDSLETEYKTTTAQDSTGYSQFSYTYRGTLSYTNFEHAPIKPNRIETVIFTLMYVPPQVDIDEWEPYLDLSDGDAIDFRQFMIAYDKLANEIKSKYNIDISSNTLNIDENQNSLTGLLEALELVIVNLRSIQNGKSNFVEIASLEKVKKLIESYSEKIINTINNTTIEFVDEAPIGDDNVVLDIQQKKSDVGVIL